MKIINPNTKYGYSLGTMRKHAKELKKFDCYGYEASMLLSSGYITALHKNKLINNCEKKWLNTIYAEDISTDDGLGTRYAINKKGEVEDYNDDVIND